MKKLWRIAGVVLLSQVHLPISSGQLSDPIADIPRGTIFVQPKLIAAGFTPEQVQENPVGFTQRVGPTDLVSILGFET